MSLPRPSKWVDSAPAATSFTTAIPVLMDEMAGVEVVYSGLDAADAYVRLKASNSGDITRARNLTDFASTMVTTNSAILFNIFNAAYHYLHLEYDAGSNTDGAINVYLSRKQKS